MDIKALQKIISQNFKTCWLCGRDDMITNHHVIPQRYKGIKNNITIPVCYNCQLIIHKEEEFVALIRRMVMQR